MKKMLLAILVIFGSAYSYADQITQKLTQDEYNKKIQEYTDQVNATKLILDEPNSTTDAKQQKEAFCSRLEAYQKISMISKENIQLDTANMMFIIANNFLDRQKQSLEASGMTSDVFCSVKVK
ncbi:hypothetical protein [uncultured Acinetobacter sp.]|uniref:hypothetical protein n=1 Tax=uncultured Acinetobacter sp. TaxID=165433 RepID=UPI0025F2C367|nr:hypothetical protein [uncultured Acinetobacter sp.]